MILLGKGCTQHISRVHRRVQTVFADGTRLDARPPWGYEPEWHEAYARALALGYGNTRDPVWEMTLDHDLVHMLLAQAEGLPHSPTLYAVATGEPIDPVVAHREECRVLFVQRALNEGIRQDQRRAACR
jgi:hypothetical protein